VSVAVPPPATEAELAARADALAGLTLGELAEARGIAVPGDLRRAKGWVGTLMERVLGATAASRDEPDFQALGIELKTLPVTLAGKPCESTFVCTIDVLRVGETEWSASRVRRKIARVLWVPVQGERTVPVAERRVGTPLLWSPSAEDEQALRADWEELAGLIGRGDLERLTGHLGRYLQVRPKAASSYARRRGVDADGRAVDVMPRGFYLRAAFTEGILGRHFVSAAGR
jgi:DNA mismatch repair protein MutH